MSFSFDKVTIETNNFVSFILNVTPFVPLVVISDKNLIFINSTLQLIIGIFKDLQKCFIGITTFAFVNESLSYVVFPIILVLHLKHLELVERGLRGSSL